MTAIRSERAPRVGVRWTKTTVVGLAFAILGVVAGLGVGNLLNEAGGTESFQGPMVDRSVAMDRSINQLIESGRAQEAAIGSLSKQYAGPLVDRSLAMDRYYASVSGAYAEPSVVRSLAMDRNIDALIEGGRAQAAALGG